MHPKVDIQLRLFNLGIDHIKDSQDKQKATSIEVALALGHYRQRWLRWCNAGLAGLKQPPFVYDDVLQSLIDLNPLET